MSFTAEDRELLGRSSNFTISLLSREQAWGDAAASHQVHKTVLLPLLEVADECWAYGAPNESEVWQSAADILVPARGKHRIRTSGDPVTGRELFWNASGGRRGTVVIVVPLAKFEPERIFAACRGAWIFGNYRAGHTPAAVKFAQLRLESKKHVVFCLPRNNGIEWAEVFAPKPQVFDLYALACKTADPQRDSTLR